MADYIAYIDLLGIKDMAKYSVDKYAAAMSVFTDKLKSCAVDVFDKDEKYKDSHVYYFSDSAFIRCKEIKAMFMYLISLRSDLISTASPLMFTAAVGVEHFNNRTGKRRNTERDEVHYTDKTKYVDGVFFETKEACEVYVLQNSFKGIGIFIDNQVLDVWRDELSKADFEREKEQYISRSFYFPSINTSNAVYYNDLKLQSNEMHSVYFQKVLKRYHSANLKSKKYGRYYLSYLANWILSEISSDKDIKSNISYINLIENKDALIDNLRNNAYKFDLLIFFLLNAFINYKDVKGVDSEAFNSIIKFIVSTSSTRKYINDLASIPEGILSTDNRDIFIDFYQTILKEVPEKKAGGRKNEKKKNKEKE